MLFDFATADRIIFGPGKASEIGVLARDLGKHALVVSGQDPRRAAALAVLHALNRVMGNFLAT